MDILIFRHAESTANASGTLAGRTPGVELSEKGKEQAIGLRSILDGFPFDTVISSPIYRCLDTAKTALPNHEPIIINDDFIELDFGDWTGLSLQELATKDEWKIVQHSPSKFQFPNGESFLDLHKRVAKGITEIVDSHESSAKIALFTHADVIKMIVTWLLDSPIDKFQRVMIDPASITIVVNGETGLGIKSVNLDANSDRIRQVLKNGN